MNDIVDILMNSKDFLLQQCDSYRLRSVLLLLDTCITQAILRRPTYNAMVRLRSKPYLRIYFLLIYKYRKFNSSYRNNGLFRLDFDSELF